jgi:hypothetical protein
MLNFAEGNMIMMGIYSLLALLISLGIYIFLIRSCIIRHREDNLDGVISFGQAFIVAMIAVAVMSVFSVAFNYIFTNIIDPEYNTKLVNAMEVSLEKMGAPEEQISQSLDRARSQANNQITNGLMWSLGLGAVVSLIAASVLKRNEPVGA